MQGCLAPRFTRLTSVAVYLWELAGKDPALFRCNLRYTPLGAIKRVCMDGVSVASCGKLPSFLWGSIQLDEEGTPYPELDTGKLPHSVERADRPGSHRVNLPGYETCEMGASYIVPECDEFSDEPWEFCYRHGLSIGQRFLAEVDISYHFDWYTGEGDVDRGFGMLYVDPPPRFPVLPILHGKLGREERSQWLKSGSAVTKHIKVEDGETLYKPLNPHGRLY